MYCGSYSEEAYSETSNKWLFIVYLYMFIYVMILKKLTAKRFFI